MLGSEGQAEDLLFRSYNRALPDLRGPDEATRRPELIADLLAELGHPERGLPCLLVAGSKGKGSTAAFAAGLLGATGPGVGLFTSPHLLDVRERIRVDAQLISREDFDRVVKRLRPVIERREVALQRGAYLSPYCLLLCGALLHFRKRGVRVAVIEAGRGARFDESRLVEHPVSAITPIYREHEQQLGPGLARIAWHKAGAIAEGGTVVSGRQRDAALAEIKAEARRQGARLLRLGVDVRARVVADGTTTVTTPLRVYHDLQPGLLGRHQADNLAVALAAVEALWPPFRGLAESDVRTAAAGVRVPGRCQVLGRSPLVLLDGAINAAGAAVFLQTALPLSRRPIAAVVAVPSDKDYTGVLRRLAPHAVHLWVTRATNPSLHFTNAPLDRARELQPDVHAEPDPARAIEAAVRAVGADGTVWLVGTQSFLADALASFQR